MTRRLLLLLSLALFFLLVAGAAAQTGTPNRIGTRVVNGTAGFFDTVTGETFTPRGVNYLDFAATPRSASENWMLATDRFDPEAIRAAFRQLAGDYQYNTVRIFFDHCDSGPHCITMPGAAGLNPAYLDNLAELIRIAADEGIYLILTSNDLPGPSLYDDLAQRETGPTMHGYRSVHFLTASGLEATRRYWEDLLTGLMERDAPLSAVLGWSLLNEQWLFEDEPPLSLQSGQVTISTGRSYDMADPAQKREMVADAVTNYATVLRDQIQALDPGALVTMGFFAPGFPNETSIGDGWFVDTAPLLERAPLDFFDFHAYPGADVSLAAMATNFGLPGNGAKPVIMGEVGAFRDRFPSADVATVRVMDWIAESCEYGFDGWLYWEYYGQPNAGDAMWGLLADNGLPLFSLSPLVQPDACVPAPVLVANVAFDQAAGASAELADGPAALAVDGSAGTAWNAGADAPQGLQVDFEQPRAIREVRLTVAQSPEGPTLHRVWALREGGDRVLIGVLPGDTRDNQVIELALPTPLAGVTGLQIATLESPSWVGWREIEAFEGDGEPVCLATLTDDAVVRIRPLGQSRSLGPLAPGDQALIASRVAGASNEWLGLPGLGFVRADLVTLDGACDTLPAEAATRRTTVPVTFVVRVPPDTVGPVYLAGDFGSAHPQWDPAGIPMEPTLAGSIWTVRLELPPGVTAAYKFTLGSWETVEKTAACAEVPNRTLTVGERPQIVRDAVAAWRVVGTCDN